MKSGNIISLQIYPHAINCNRVEGFSLIVQAVKYWMITFYSVRISMLNISTYALWVRMYQYVLYITRSGGQNN